MKNRLLIFATVALCAIGMISCGNPAEPENINLTYDNAEQFVVNMGQYDGLTVEASKEEVTDDMLNYYVDYFYSVEAMELENWPAANGDTVVMDYVGKIDGVAFNGGTGNDQKLVLGSGSFIPGFEDGLIGVKKGDVLDLNLKFPDDYRETSIAGKDCVFSVTVKGVIPAICDEAIAALGSNLYKTVAEFKTFASEVTAGYASDDYQQEVVFGAVNQIIASTEFAEIPESILNLEKEVINETYASVAAQYGVGVSEYLSLGGSSIDSLAREYAQQEIVFYNIAKAQNLYPSEEDITENAELFATYYGYENVDAYFAENPKEDFINTLISNNVYNYLLEVTNVIAPTEE